MMKGYTIKMTNLKEVMKSSEAVFNSKQRASLINDAHDIIGTTKYLMVCVEEIAELIEVIINNNKHINYIHTAEEIADVRISINIILVICDIKSSKIGKIDTKKKSKKQTISNMLNNLSKSQQYISKYVRCRKDGDEKLVSALSMMAKACYDAETIYKIKKKDIEKIENIKYERLLNRLTNGII